MPLSAILMLVLCVGTDIAPCFSLAFEEGEMDIMKRLPRNSKRDRLVGLKLIAFAYMQIGFIEFAAGMFTYFVVLNDYGIPFGTAVFLSNQIGYFP